jgi:hypothetical protein
MFITNNIFAFEFSSSLLWLLLLFLLFCSGVCVCVFVYLRLFVSPNVFLLNFTWKKPTKYKDRFFLGRGGVNCCDPDSGTLGSVPEFGN